jgi:hypothetical protein
MTSRQVPVYLMGDVCTTAFAGHVARLEAMPAREEGSSHRHLSRDQSDNEHATESDNRIQRLFPGGCVLKLKTEEV